MLRMGTEWEKESDMRDPSNTHSILPPPYPLSLWSLASSADRREKERWESLDSVPAVSFLSLSCHALSNILES